MKKIWEQFISLNSDKNFNGDILLSAKNYFNDDYIQKEDYMIDFINSNNNEIEKLLNVDIFPLPIPSDREGYYGNNHFSYWLSGLMDLMQINSWMNKNNIIYNSVLDLGCASGRLLRHFFNYQNIKTIGCDINRIHIDWVSNFLPQEIVVFQNTSIPHIPLPDNSVDLITAFSIFTHIESFDTTWLMEINRILSKNGIAWITVNNDRILKDMLPTWPLYNHIKNHNMFDKNDKILTDDRLIIRYDDKKSYSSYVFYKDSYILKSWGKILNIIDHFPAIPIFQEIYVMKKK